MLRIKEGIELKELEKFGFKLNGAGCWVKNIDNSDFENFETEIVINPLNAIIKNQIVHYINNSNDLWKVEEELIDLTSEIDIIYDLIKADIVEKC